MIFAGTAGFLDGKRSDQSVQGRLHRIDDLTAGHVDRSVGEHEEAGRGAATGPPRCLLHERQHAVGRHRSTGPSRVVAVGGAQAPRVAACTTSRGYESVAASSPNRRSTIGLDRGSDSERGVGRLVTVAWVHLDHPEAGLPQD